MKFYKTLEIIKIVCYNIIASSLEVEFYSLHNL